MQKTYDVVIVGAGAIGLAIGWRSSQLGMNVLVVDRGGKWGAASYIAAGMLAPITEANFGEERLLRLNLESARRFPGFLDDLSEASGAPLSAEGSGTLSIARDRDEAESLLRLFEFQKSAGLEVVRLSAEECRALEPALRPSIRAGVLASGDKAVDPRRMICSLELALVKSGAELMRDVIVSKIETRRGAVRGVELSSGGHIFSASVVVAAGCWSAHLGGVPAEVASAIRPVKGQILRLRSRPDEPPLARHLIRSEEVYVVARPGGEVVVGATVEEKGFDDSVTAGGVYELLRGAEDVLPAIRELAVTQMSAGLRPATPDNAPLLGPCSIQGMLIATGHHRNGILLTPITADSISTLMATGQLVNEIAPFDPMRFAR